MVTEDKLTTDCANHTPPRVSGLWLAATVFIGVLLSFYGHWCFQAPPPASSQVSQFQFQNAWDHLEEVSGSDQPHPPGTAEHKRVGKYLVQVLSDLGYQVSIQVTKPHYVWGKKQTLQNIIAIRRPGSMARSSESTVVAGQGDWKRMGVARRKLLFVCHYDSHPSGPGAGDDGAAVASLLEVARIEAQRTIGERDIVFLFTDGEEAGLLGAQDWVAECPWLDSVDLVFNFEGRGTSGPAYLFETSAGDLNLIRNFANQAPRPSGNSLAREVYRYMPNGTDFTVFITNRNSDGKVLSSTMPAGNLSGQNFAFVGSVENYHTPEDRPENLDANSLSHHGQTAEALLNFYRDAPIETTTQDAVYFDVAGRYMLWWPEDWNWIWLAINLLLFATCVICCRIGSVRDIVFGNVASIILTITMMLLIWITVIAFGQKYWFQPFWGHWVPIVGYGGALAAFWCVALVGWSVSGCLVECITKDKSLWVAVWAFWTLLTVAVVVFIPGGSFLFLIPLTAACGCRLMGHAVTGATPAPLTNNLEAEVGAVDTLKSQTSGWRAEHPLFMSVLPCVVTWLIWFPVQRALLAGLAYRIPNLYIGLVPLLISPAIPLVTVVSYRSKIILTIIAMAAFALLVGALLAN